MQAETITRDGTFAGKRGLPLYWRSWLPATSCSAVVVLAHGGGEHGGRYGHVADRLVATGCAVYACDHRGHGRSQGSRAKVDRYDDYVDDLETFFGLVGEQQPDLRPFLVGHSLGSAISLLYALRHQDSLAGMVLSGAPVTTGEVLGSGQKLVAKALSAVLPRLPIVAVDSASLSHDPAVVDGYDDDPLVYHGKLDARMVGETLRAMSVVQSRADELRLPLLLLHGERDTLASADGSRYLHERASSTDKTLKIYPGMFHEIFNEVGRNEVIGDLVDWIAARS